MSPGLAYLRSLEVGDAVVLIRTTSGKLVHDEAIRVLAAQEVVIRPTWSDDNERPAASIRVRDSEWNPVLGCRFTCPDLQPRLWLTGDGADIYADDTARAFPLVLHITHPSYEDAVVELSEGESRELQLAALPHVRVIVSSPEEINSPSLVTLTRVPLRIESSSSGPSHHDVVPPGGSTVFDVLPGQWELVAETADSTVPLRRRFETRGGLTTVALETPGSLLIVCKHQELVARSPTIVLLEREGGVHHAGRLTSDTLEVHGLFPGEYRLEVMADAHSAKMYDVRVNSRRRTVVELESLSGSPSEVTFPRGWGSAAWLAFGDVFRWREMGQLTASDLHETYTSVPWKLFELRYGRGALLLQRGALPTSLTLPSLQTIPLDRLEFEPSMAFVFCALSARALWRDAAIVVEKRALRFRMAEGKHGLVFLRSRTQIALVSIWADEDGVSLSRSAFRTIKVVGSPRAGEMSIELVPLGLGDISIPLAVARKFRIAGARLSPALQSAELRIRAPGDLTVGVLHRGRLVGAGAIGQVIALSDP
jgi:hypothetical protein